MDKRDVPLLTKKCAREWLDGDQYEALNPPDELVSCFEAIASGNAAVYNTHTHEIVPKGTREARKTGEPA